MRNDRVPFRLSPSLAFAIGPQPCCISGFAECAGGKIQNRPRGILLTRDEADAVELEEKNAYDESRPFVAIDKGMITDDACRIERGHCDDVTRVGIGMVLGGPSQSGLEKPSVPQCRGTAVSSQEPVVDREDLAFFYPVWFFGFHFARACRVSR